MDKGTRAILLFLGVYAGLICITHVRLLPLFFLHFGDTAIVFPKWASIGIAATVVVAFAVLGLMSLAGCRTRNEVGMPVLWGALSASAAVGFYLLPYSTMNGAIAGASLITVLAATVACWSKWWNARTHGAAWSARDDAVVPCAKVAIVLGMVLCLMPHWTSVGPTMQIEYPDSEDERGLAAHVETAEVFLDESAYRKMGFRQRLSGFGELVEVACNHLGVREVPSLEVTDCLADAVAAYDHEKNVIRVNPVWLMSFGRGEVMMRAAFHESAHRYQHECVERGYGLPPEESGWGQESVPDALVDEWRRNFEHYNPAFGERDAYVAQSIEADAREYSERAMEEVRTRLLRHVPVGEVDPIDIPASAEGARFKDATGVCCWRGGRREHQWAMTLGSWSVTASNRVLAAIGRKALDCG